MARDMNIYFVIGRLTKDPELKYLTNGTPITTFSIAVNDSYKQGDQYVEYTSFFEINVFGKQADSCAKYLRKGSQVQITAKLKQNRWTDKETNKAKSKIVITAESVQFLGSSAKKEG